MLTRWPVTILLVLCLFGPVAPILRGEDAPKSPPIPRAFLDAQKDPKAGFPLQPGYRWSYVTGGRYSMFLETRGGSSSKEAPSATLVARRSSIFWERTLILGAQDGMLYRQGGSLTPTIPLIPLHPKEGQTWEAKDEEEFSELVFRASVLARERVTVPAGEFDAWKIQYDLLENLGTLHDLRVWFTPGIGIVKVERWRESSPIGKKVLAEPIVQELVRIEDVLTAHPVDYPSEPQPLSVLPKSVRAPAGKVTLFADFADRWDRGVVLYLVNRSPEGISYPKNGSDRFVKLEARRPDGAWERCQGHSDYWCTVGETAGSLEPDSFVEILGHEPERGEERDVRYRGHGGLDVVSNTGRGRVDPAEILEARFDALAFREGGVQLLEEALFKSASFPADLREHARNAAFEHMQTDPWAEDIPILQRLLEECERTDRWDDQILEMLHHHSERRTLEYAIEALRAGPPARRRYVLRNLGPLPFDREIFDLLLEQARDPKLAGLPAALEYLGATENDDVKPVLEEIKKSARYPAAARAEAAYQLAYHFTPGPLAVQVTYTDLPGTISVTLTNEGDRPLSFTYGDPREIVRVFLKLDDEYVAPRGSVAWFSRAKPEPADARVQRVVLERGEQHSLNVNVLVYFDVAEALKSSKTVLTATVTARVPSSGQPRAARGWTVISSGEP